MATKFLVQNGKLLKKGKCWDDGTGGKLKLLTWACIGDEYQVMDLTAGTLVDISIARADATGVTGDRIDDNRDIAEFG